jgi:hypothetical protein
VSPSIHFSSVSETGATVKKAKKAKKATAKKTVKKKGQAVLKGCCTIEYDNKADEQVENVTKAECTRLGRARGGTGQWSKGACA